MMDSARLAKSKGGGGNATRASRARRGVLGRGKRGARRVAKDEESAEVAEAEEDDAADVDREEEEGEEEEGCSRQQLDSATAKASATEHTKEAPSTAAARKPAPKPMRKPAAKKPSRTSLTSRVPCSGSVSLHDEGVESASRETAASRAVAVDLQKVSAWANRTHRAAPLMDD